MKGKDRKRTQAKLVMRLLFSTVRVARHGFLSLDSFGMRSEVLNLSTGAVPMKGFGVSRVRVMVESKNDPGENTAPVPSNSIGPLPISVSSIVDVFEKFREMRSLACICVHPRTYPIAGFEYRYS